jgi:hypothetical protein
VLVRLDLPYADLRAGDLSHALGAEPLPGLETLVAQAGEWRVELRLLGCSHQALVDGGEEICETVACRPGVQGNLPPHRRGGARTGDYAFRARIERLATPAYEARAAGILAVAAHDPRSLVGVFPSDRGAAFTALRLDALPGQVAWTTWHGYPQTGELVVTESRLEARR